MLSYCDQSEDTGFNSFPWYKTHKSLSVTHRYIYIYIYIHTYTYTHKAS